MDMVLGGESDPISCYGERQRFLSALAALFDTKLKPDCFLIKADIYGNVIQSK